ncbi:fem1a [Symbiodinium necroappetens]|uniref:Fem1a protein n=1 Tax=Symbiodinium necroappetens TaxID=1628268 RepID=A0A812SMA2_9DINO|nr:fem1a [Symbiodinium necroappetens]
MAAMLRVWRVSGEELISIPVEELTETDAGELKRRLQSVCGWPKSFQRLLHEGAPLEDDAQLDCAMDVQLVMLPLESGSGTSQDQLNSALVDAAREGELEIITQLLEARADLDGCDSTGAPLHAACRNGQKEIATLLLDLGADIDRESPWGNTPLCEACEGDHDDVVEMLGFRGADPNLGCPLVIAQNNGNDDIMEMLIHQFGASTACLRPNFRDHSPDRWSFGSGSSF